MTPAATNCIQRNTYRWTATKDTIICISMHSKIPKKNKKKKTKTEQWVWKTSHRREKYGKKYWRGAVERQKYMEAINGNTLERRRN
jgi:hypothetical protein